jgi:hypothetical protein
MAKLILEPFPIFRLGGEGYDSAYREKYSRYSGQLPHASPLSAGRRTATL